MASLDNQVARFLNYEFDVQSRGNKRLTINKIKEIHKKFDERCEEIRVQALNGNEIYHSPRELVWKTYSYYSNKLKYWEREVASSEIYGPTSKKELQQVLKNTKQEVEKTYKKYSPPDSEKQGPLAVKFKPGPNPTNKTEYDGPGHPKVETPLNFKAAPFADKDFTEQHRRKDPCNCTIL